MRQDDGASGVSGGLPTLDSEQPRLQRLVLKLMRRLLILLAAGVAGRRWRAALAIELRATSGQYRVGSQG